MAKSALDTIRERGYENAAGVYESWIANAAYEAKDPEEDRMYPLDEFGNPVRAAYEDLINSDLWEFGFDEMEEDPKLRRIFAKHSLDELGDAFFDGVRRFVDENWKTE